MSGIIGLIIQGVGLGTGIVGITLVYRQLKQSRDIQRENQFVHLVEMEEGLRNKLLGCEREFEDAAIESYLNFFDLLSILFVNGKLDNKLIREYFKTMIISTYEWYGDKIIELQKSEKNIYSSFEKLYRRIKDERQRKKN